MQKTQKTDIPEAGCHQACLRMWHFIFCPILLNKSLCQTVPTKATTTAMPGRDSLRTGFLIQRSQNPIPNALTANKAATITTAAVIRDVRLTRDASRLPAAAPMIKKEKQDLQALQILFYKQNIRFTPAIIIPLHLLSPKQNLL